MKRSLSLQVWSLLLVTLLVPLALPEAVCAAAGKKAKEGKEAADEKDGKDELVSAKTFSGLALRGIGPALTSGRVVDFAVDPANRKNYFVATASGGLWKTTNSGTTWTPVFDGEASYSIGCVALDPADPLVVWVGTGENNSQRSVAYGDGVYKSTDGGTTWENVGLPESEHIGEILIDPRDSNVVWVAAQGPLWRAGGDRGLYKTTDGGKTLKKLPVPIDAAAAEHTGVSDLAMDPRDPDVVYAAAYQRRRRVWTLINGGPGSGLFKTTDGGATWTKLERGLPKAEMGRIGIALSPADPDVVYAIIEAAGEEAGFYRSTDAGANWEKQSDYVSGSPQYYQELVADPLDPDRVYSLDTFGQVTEDGGKTFRRTGQADKHVDEHALWIDPEDTDYLLSGCDGGVYESFDRGATWHYKANLPLVQFYKIAVDDDAPFYNVYGGTQDNNTLGGPSRTRTVNGITNREWFVTRGGDGFEPAVDPEDPNILYSQAQYGELVRFDRRSGETIDIQPQPAPGDDPLRWNWDSGLLLSPHSPSRLYFAAQRVFKSDDRGDSWRPVSGDLTRGLDRNELEVMGKVWSVDAVSKNRSTSPFGNVVSLAESPLVEDLLYAGTDDGLVQVLEPGAAEWRRVEAIAGVPAMPYVADLVASAHDPNTVYAALDRHKDGDFKPYLAKSADRGETWTLLSGDLPERGTVYSVAEDPEDPSLLFAGTELGVFASLDGGGRWVRLQGGIPTIAVRDLEIQGRERDLVAGTFGRGIYVLDDLSPLRGLGWEDLKREAILFPLRDAKMFMESSPLSLPGKAFMGTSFYTAPNPPFGAVFTYYLHEELKTRKKARQEAEAEVEKTGGQLRYPSWDDLRAEDREKEPAIELTVLDAEGAVVRRLTGPAGAGFHRVAWDLRWPPSDPTSLEPPGGGLFDDPPRGPMAVPGTYTVTLAKRVDGEVTPLGEPRTFAAVPVGEASLRAQDLEALHAFQQKTARLQRAVLGAVAAVAEARERIDHVQKALLDTPAADAGMREAARELDARLLDLTDALQGDRTVRSRNEPIPPSITRRVARIVSGHWASTSAPTRTQMDSYAAAAESFAGILERLRALDGDLTAFEEGMEEAGAPWTPGRLPRWQPE